MSQTKFLTQLNIREYTITLVRGLAGAIESSIITQWIYGGYELYRYGLGGYALVDMSCMDMAWVDIFWVDMVDMVLLAMV